MHIWPTRLLENVAPITNYNLEEKPCRKSASLNLSNNNEIEEIIATIKDNKDNVENRQKKK